jgi:hypothetical protein
MRATDNSITNPPSPLCLSVSVPHSSIRQNTPLNRNAQNEPTAPRKPTPRHNPRQPCKTNPPVKTTAARKPLPLRATKNYNLATPFQFTDRGRRRKTNPPRQLPTAMLFHKKSGVSPACPERAQRAACLTTGTASAMPCEVARSSYENPHMPGALFRIPVPIASRSCKIAPACPVGSFHRPLEF